ncbi:MAG: glycosyltransferase [Planctomycetes bacterium]|nr:glycosyltransferase [Planctomycetota bacterium]
MDKTTDKRKKSSRQTICLNMIVKNETEVIKRCLGSLKHLIDYWVIVDTGSTDGTQDMVREFMRDIPGELVERPWVDFGYNRSEALEYARGKADYVFTIDADEMVWVEQGFRWPKLTDDSYLINLDDNGLIYRRCQIVNNKLKWHYKGVLHEYIDCHEAKSQGFLQDFKTIRLLDGARSSDPHKFKKDALLLEKALLDEPDNDRYVFYLAQSYRDAGEPDLAIKYYQQRVSMGRWDQEEWYSLYQLALLSQQKGVPWPQVMEAFLRAYEFRPSRPEPLYRIMQHYMGKEYHTAYLFGKQAIDIPFPEDILFVENYLYHYLLPLDFAVCCYWSGHNAEAIRVNNRLLSQPGVPVDLLLQGTKNRRFSLDLLYEKKQEVKQQTNTIKICVPFHNPGHWLDNTVESLLHQDYKKFDVIFVDDASSDGSHQAVPSDYKHIKLVRNKTRQGKGKIMTTFIEQNTQANDICLMLDGVSWLANKKVLSFVNQYYNEHECQLFYGQFRQANGKLGNTMPFPDEEALSTAKEYSFESSLKTFRVELYQELSQADPELSCLKDDNGKWLDDGDANHQLICSLMEQAGFKQVHFTDEVLSVVVSVTAQNNNLNNSYHHE